MALTPLQAFRIIAKEYSTIADEDVEQYIEFVLPLVSEKRFGTLYSRAVALLTAHTMKMTGVDEGSGTGNSVGSGNGEVMALKSMGVASYSEGSTSISFQSSSNSSTSNGSDTEYESTVYGIQYLTLRKSLPNITIRGGCYG